MASLLEQISVERSGLRRRPFQEFYHSVLKMTWWYFVINVSLVYIFINLIFASLYWLGGDSILNATPGSFFDAFVFSNQTFATIGYGFFLPKTTYAHLLVIVESIVGLLFTSIITGLTFAKFSKPTTHVIFSNKALITPFDGVPTLMFRIGNGRDTNIVDARLEVLTMVPQKTKEGISMQRFVKLNLERSHSPFFILTWTVMHKIDQESPFYNFKEEDFKNSSILVSLIGFDETYSQTVHTSHRYTFENFHFNKKFKDVVEMLPNGNRHIHFEHFHDLDS